MFDWLTYKLINDFQSLIVGAVGFSGIILTLRQSAKLTREQHERGVRHERTLITRALLVELRRNRDAFEFNLGKFGEIKEGSGILMPVRSITELYEQNFDRIAHLNDDSLTKVLEAYSRIKAVPERLIFAKALDEKHDEPDKPGHLFVHPDLLWLYKTLLANAVSAINDAIAALEAS